MLVGCRAPKPCHHALLQPDMHRRAAGEWATHLSIDHVCKEEGLLALMRVAPFTKLTRQSLIVRLFTTAR